MGPPVRFGIPDYFEIVYIRSGQTHGSAPTIMYNPDIHHRRSIRLNEYDYSSTGLYFLTICVQGRACLFGEMVNGEMLLNDARRMVEKWYLKLEAKFPDIKCGEYVVMPNHFHCIVENVGANDFIPVGADPCVRPTPKPTLQTPTLQTPETQTRNIDEPKGSSILGEHMGSPLQKITQWFKTMTTNEYIRNVKAKNWPRFEGKLWQRNYWEHIIRTEKSYLQIADYIVNNPLNWDTDSINPTNEQQSPSQASTLEKLTIL